MYFGMYPDTILFIAGTFFAVLGLLFVVYLLAFRKRSRVYAQVLQQETELFDALTATATLSQNKLFQNSSPQNTPIYNNPGYNQHNNPAPGYNPHQTHYPPPQPRPFQNNKHTEYITQPLASLFQPKVVDKPIQSSDPSGFNPAVIENAYTIEQEVGGGAMSRTFVVRNKKLGNLWFLKFISSRHGNLANEANILKLLNHSSLPRIVDIYHQPEGVYLIVTLVEGIPLNTLKETEIKLSQYVLVDWFEQIAQTLNYLHGMKPMPVFHLDLKPGNIMVTHDNRLVLVDFGISRRFGEGPANAVTANYAAPEQFGQVPSRLAQIVYDRFGHLPPDSNRWPIDARTDIYSLGVVMFELATGHAPTQRNLWILKDHVSREIAAIILKCLTTYPAGRYHSAAELLEDLRKVKGSKIKMARTLLLRRIAGIAAVLTLIISGGLFFGGYRVFAFENGASLAIQPEIVTVSVQQSTAVIIDRHLPDGRITPMETSQITWEAARDNIAHIDGGRITGMNVGETQIRGTHRNSDVLLHVRVVEPIEDLIEISQRYRIGRTVDIFAGTATRQRVDGNLAAMDFFSPESITITSDGTIYVSDAGVVRRISDGTAETVHKDLGFITADMVRAQGNQLFILTSPWQELDGRYVHAIAQLVDGTVDFIYIADAMHTAIEDFAFGADGMLYLILRNEGLGRIFLKSIDLISQTSPTIARSEATEQSTLVDFYIITELPPGSTSLTVADDGAIYIGNTIGGAIQVFINNELRNFAGLMHERGFIDGTSPRFFSPQRLEHHGDYLYVWDFNTLRRIQAIEGIAGEAITVAGIASPVYERDLGITAHNAEDIILPHGRMMDIVVTDNGVLVTDHKRGVIWRVAP